MVGSSHISISDSGIEGCCCDGLDILQGGAASEAVCRLSDGHLYAAACQSRWSDFLSVVSTPAARGSRPESSEAAELRCAGGGMQTARGEFG